MQVSIFGRRKLSAPIRLDRVLVPRGAVASADAWALGEALHLFVTDARERSLFRLDELPSDAVAVFRAYELANALSDRLLTDWFASFEPDPVRVADTVRGLQLIGARDVAKVMAAAGQAWARRASLAGFETTRAQENPLIGQCSQWARTSSLLVVLGDGALDTVYKEAMKQLGRCNPDYSERRRADDLQCIRQRLKPVSAFPRSPCTLDALIAEMQQAYG